MQSLEEYLKYAEACERMAKTSAGEDREALLSIARAWRRCAQELKPKRSG
jgi:hypothetical protein